MTANPNRRWFRLVAGVVVVTLAGVVGPAGVASAAPAPAALAPAQGPTDPGGGSTGGTEPGGTGTGTGAGSGGTDTGGAGTGTGGIPAIGGSEGRLDPLPDLTPDTSAAEAEAAAAASAASAARQAARDRAEAARKAAEAERKAAERAAKAAAQAARNAAQARETWDRRGRPHRLIIIRDRSIDLITDGRLTKRTARSGSLTLAGLSRIAPDSFLTINGDTARLKAAIVLSVGATLDVSGVKTLQLAGGNAPADATFLYTGRGRITVTGVTVTSVDGNGQPLPANAAGRPYIVVSGNGRFDATDATISDLGVQPVGADKGEPGLDFNAESTGSLVRTKLLRNTVGLELSKSRNVRLDTVDIAEAWSDGLLLQGDKGTVLTGITAERNGGNGVAVGGETSDRPITNITTRGNHSFGLVVTGQTKPQITGITTTGDGAGGLRLNRSTDALVRDFTATDQPIGIFTHVNASNVTLDKVHVTGGRRAIVVEKTTKGLNLTNSVLEGSRVAGIAIGGHDVHLTDVSITDARTAFRMERGAGNVAATRLKISGGQDGIVTSAGTTNFVLTDLVADGVENDTVRNFSPGAKIIGGHISGGLTGLDLEAATTVSGTVIGLSNEGIRARTENQVVEVDNVTVDAVTVGMNVAAGSQVQLTNSRVHALQAVRGTLANEEKSAGNDLSLPPLNLLGAIGIPLVVLALVLEAMHATRQRRFGGGRRHQPPALPAMG
jgi:hypothetical protein